MERDILLSELNEVFVDVFDDENLIITEQTNASDIAEWDSLTNIELIVAIEKKFKIRFTSSEIQSWQHVGEICTSIENKLR